jgi:hypothetical protein
MQVISINKNPSKKGAHDGGWRKEVMRENAQQRECGRVAGGREGEAYSVSVFVSEIEAEHRSSKIPEFQDLACAC